MGIEIIFNFHPPTMTVRILGMKIGIIQFSLKKQTVLSLAGFLWTQGWPHMNGANQEAHSV